MAGKQTTGPEVLGARASNAGDDFHVLWALHHALRVLDLESGLTAVTVEGVQAPSSNTLEAGAWDGVDVALYFGGVDLASAQRVEIAQLKYSTADPTLTWTVARLCKSSATNVNNSVIGRLAKAWKAAVQAGVSRSALSVKLVSNQPIAREVQASIEAGLLGTQGKTSRLAAAWDRMQTASGLAVSEFPDFVRCLDFADCESPSRFEVKQHVIWQIARIAASNVRPHYLELRDAVYTRMLPGNDTPITRATLLAAMSVADIEALFPCPSRLKLVERAVKRAAVQDVLKHFENGKQRVLLHGAGGTGKTTALQELRAKLPPQSEMFVFDCYGAGSYLDSDGQRHHPAQAFLHLSNEIASRLGVPILVSASTASDFVKAFVSRVTEAATLLASRQPKALLVIAADAADNSITAARERVPPEPSFISDLVTLGELPANARLLISARTGRLPELRLSGNFEKVEINNFTYEESVQFVRMQWSTPSEGWLQDFYVHSEGNPRVMAYALEYAGTKPEKALDYLLPHGKDLSGIFKERIDEAIRKGGSFSEFDRVCAGLVALPRPIPTVVLAAILGSTPEGVQDLANDLGLRNDSGLLSFRDEDFEDFVRVHAANFLPQVRKSAAEYFLRYHRSDPYCAEHIASVLFDAGERAALLALAQSDPTPKAIADPVKRRDAQLHRMKLAMRVAGEAGDKAEAILVLLRGAEALKTDAAVQSMLADNLELSTQFAYESVRKKILFNPDREHLHGRALCGLARASVLRGDAVRARDYRRQFREWFEKYRRHADEEKVKERNGPGWILNNQDLAVDAESVLLLAGPKQVVEVLSRWRPRTLMPRVIFKMVHSLIASGREALVEQCLEQVGQKKIWDVLLTVPLALAGRSVDVDQLDSHLGSWLRRGWLKAQQRSDRTTDSTSPWDTAELLLVGAEIVASRKGVTPNVRRILEEFARPERRRIDLLHTFDHEPLDATLRAHSLLTQAGGSRATTQSFLVSPEPRSEPKDEKERRARRHEEDRAKEVESLISHLLPAYVARAALLLLPASRAASLAELAKASAASGDFRLRNDHHLPGAQDRLGESIASLMHLTGLLPVDIGIASLHAMNFGKSAPTSVELRALDTMALHAETRPFLLERLIAAGTAILAEKSPASEKADGLLSIARVLRPISPTEANAIFNQATIILEELDLDSMSELAMLEHFSSWASEALDDTARRLNACAVADFATEAHAYIGTNDSFPWGSVARTASRLDPSVALAAVARWEDEGAVSRESTLQDALLGGISNGQMGADVVLSILPLTDQLDNGLLTALLSVLRTDAHLSPTRSNELARQALKRESRGEGIGPIRRIAEELGAADSQWIAQCRELATFLDRKKDTATRTDREISTPTIPSQFSKCRFVTKPEIDGAVGLILEEARNAKSYVGTRAIFSSIREVVSAADRATHIDLLAHATFENVDDDDRAVAVARAIIEWRARSPAIAEWCKAHIPKLVADLLPEFRWSLGLLVEMLDACDLPRNAIHDALMEGLERHAHRWDARTVYETLGIVARYTPPDQAALVLTRELEAQCSRIGADTPRFDPHDIPTEIHESVGRFLYAYLGDFDLRLRWRAASCLRSAARLSQGAIVDAAVSQWQRSSDSSYRKPGATYYWLASRLWLLIALSRIAEESPDAVKKHSSTLVNIALDEGFPHVLCVHFAKVAVESLVRHQQPISAGDLRQLKAANAGRVRPTKRTEERHATKDRLRNPNEGRKFHFDSMDTIPYWYSQKLRMFADVSMEDFLDRAEHWIVNKWGGREDITHWVNEPRRARIPYGSSLTLHRHGSLPTLERPGTHLEWHAMWCVIGELLRSEPLARGESDYGSWSYETKRMGLTHPPYWLSDLRALKPLDDRVWFSWNDASATWLAAVTEDSLFKEISAQECRDDELVIASNYELVYGDQRASISVSSALVSPKTASSLLRALQSIENDWDYRLPHEGDEAEIRDNPFFLEGWLALGEGDRTLDDEDPERRNVGDISILPGPSVQKAFDLRPLVEEGGEVSWTPAPARQAFRYRAWSDIQPEHEDRTTSDFVRSSGHRLYVSKELLQEYLHMKQMDLLIEVQENRRTKETDPSGFDDSKEAKEAYYDRVLVFRRDGSIEAAEGRVGTWTISRARAPARGRRGHPRPVDGASHRSTTRSGKQRTRS